MPRSFASSASSGSVPGLAPPTPRETSGSPGLVGPPVALAIDVLAPSVAETGRADNEDFEASGPASYPRHVDETLVR